jgi:hypothetical protein
VLLEFGNRFRGAVVGDDKIFLFETLDRNSLFVGDVDLDELQGDLDFILQRNLFLANARGGRKNKDAGDDENTDRNG